MNDDGAGSSRRTFLSAVGVTGAFLGVGELVALDRQQVATEYVMGGRVSGWQGREPASIGQTVNPTLNLEAGQTYEITWENLDGAPHNVAILADDGTVLQRTDIISEQGATQTLQFTATEEMAIYVCQVHPNTMQGSIAIGGGAPGGNQTMNRTGNQTTMIPNPTEAPVTETEHPLADEFGEDPQRFIAHLEPVEGVETAASGTTYFTLHPPNGVQPVLMYVLRVENLGQIVSATIRLDDPAANNPVLASLFTRAIPTGDVTGTVVDAELTRSDLRGPFQGESLLRLVEAIRNDNVFVQVRTMDYPMGAVAGPVQEVNGAQTANGTPTDDGEGETETATEGTATETEAEETPTETPTEEIATEEAEMANDGEPADLARRVQMPGFGMLAALGGISGAAGYLISREGDDE